jgi:2Fe-2S ferredoxin
MVRGLSTDMRAQCRVTFKKDFEEFVVDCKDEAPSILELAIRSKIDLPHSCGGNATCGTCRVFVENNVDKLPPREGVELEMAEDRGFAANERLSCQIPPVHGLVLRIPKVD